MSIESLSIAFLSVMHNLNVAVLLVVGILVTVATCESDYDKVVRCVNEAKDATLSDDHCNQEQSNDGEVAVVKECCVYHPAITQADVGKYQMFSHFSTNITISPLLFTDSKIKAFTDSFTSKIGNTISCVVHGSHNQDLTTLTLSVDCTNLTPDDSSNCAPLKSLNWKWGW